MVRVLRIAGPLLLLGGIAALRLPAQTPHRWVPLGAVAGVPVDVDSLSLTRPGPGRASLVVRLGGFAGALTERLERHEVECAARRSRVLSARDQSTPGAPVAFDSAGSPAADSSWRVYPPGSLGRELLERMCRWVSTTEDAAGP